ncbi:MAG: hypothetical protein IJQ80_06655 [Clostridia bacterium]|nr:hypothetical protein [Clostridia bacterium]
MKKLTKILAFALVVIMLCPALASCGGDEAVVKVRFVVTCGPGGGPILDDKGEIMYDDDGKEVTEKELGWQTVTVKGTKNDPPNALKAATQALAALDFEDGYEITADGYSIKRVKEYDLVQIEDEEGEDDSDDLYGYYYYWNLYVNGEASTDGRQSITEIYEGDELVFKYMAGKQKREDVAQNNAEQNADNGD